MISLFENLSIPVVLWDYEGPTFTGGANLIFRYLNGKFFRNFIYFCIDSEVALDYRRRGYTSFFLPFGVDPRLANYRVPESLKHSFQHDLLYVGTAATTPIYPNPQQHGSSINDYFLNLLEVDLRSIMLRIIKDPSIEAALSRVHAKILPVMKELLRADIESPYVFQEHEVRVAKAYTALLVSELPRLKDFAEQMSTIVGLRLRLGYSHFQLTNRLDRLIPQGIRIYGEGHWGRLLLNYPHEVRRLSYPEMYAAFHNSKMVFSYTKKLFLSSVHERVFHILGVGGCPLIDRRADLELLFERDEVAAYESFEELQQLLHFYTRHETARLKLIEKGRKKVFASHTYAHRLADLLWAVCRETGAAMPSIQALSLTEGQNWIETMTHPPKIGLAR